MNHCHWTNHRHSRRRGGSLRLRATAFRATAALVLLVATGCPAGGDDSVPRIFTDAGGLATPVPVATIGNGAGTALRPWPPPGIVCVDGTQCPPDPGARSVYVTISGEANALIGYPFPPNDWVNDTYFVDGWDFELTEYIVVIDKINMWSGPNQNPAAQGSLSGMTRVAHLDGPYVVDLHKGGAIAGQGGAPEQATALGVLTQQDDNGGAAFDPTTSYGFGFSTVSATYDAYNVNLTADEAPDFATMVQNGYSVFYRGHLTWKGDRSPYGCSSTRAETGGATTGVDAAGIDGASVDAGPDTSADDASTNRSANYDYTAMPNSGISLAFGFSTPTDYVNCQNMALQGTPNPGEDYPRGIQVSPSQSTIAQVTIHMDHPFWESLAENSRVHFDAIAAQYVGRTQPVATVEDMRGVAFYAFTDRNGTPLPWRSCSDPKVYSFPGNGQMNFDTLSVPVNPHGACDGTIGDDFTRDACPALRDYFDYLRFTQSTQGHLNSQGLCFVDRHYPAPPGGS